MTPEDNEPTSEHSVEIVSPPSRVVIVRRRPYSLLIGAAALGLTGILLGAFLVARQRASDEHLTTDALQREELRDGWKTLGAAAVLDAQSASPPPASPPAANVLIVNVPGQAGPQGPQGMPGQTVIVPSNGTAATMPSMPSGSATGSTGNGSSTSIAPIAVPVSGYGASTPTQQSPVNGVLPSGVGQPAGNANTPGSTSNPALPGNGNTGTAFPSPGATNGSLNIPNPTSNLPSGSSNLPSGSSSLPSGVP